MLGRRVVEAARAQIGTPYRDRSAQAGKSVCCYGLVLVVAASLGVELPGLDELGRPDLETARSMAHRHLGVLHADAEGALVLMAGLGQRRASVHHWGFLTARSRGGCRGIIHSHRQAGMVIEEPYSRTWQRMTCGHFELPG